MKLSELGKAIINIQGSGTVAIITDSNVAPLYLNVCEESINAAGLTAVSFIVPAGEKSKNATQYIELLEKLASIPLTRADGIVALGGGVVGDLAGFVAATYMRGVKLYQVPTTLLAMVDSSIGGKVGVDLAEGKNLVGAFYLPSLVFRDAEVLKTLPESVFREGCAEVIKYGIILDKELFDILDGRVINCNMTDEESSDASLLTSIVDRCAGLKTDIVAQDLHDNGVRQILNFGHTIGHAIEKLSGYTVSHGDAVAKGMLRMAEIAEDQGWCDADVTERIKNILIKYGFSLAIPYAAEELFSVILNDKKRRGGTIDIIVPRSIGQCAIERIDINRFGELLIV